MKTFEENLKELKVCVSELENGNLELSKALGFYKDGLKALKAAREQLEEARKEVQVLADGEWSSE